MAAKVSSPQPMENHNNVLPSSITAATPMFFRGDVLATDGDIKQGDQYFNKIINSFRPLSRRAISAGKTKSIHYVKAKQDFTFKKLAQFLKMDQFGEQELRIINDYPSRGEPKPGEWIKIIR